MKFLNLRKIIILVTVIFAIILIVTFTIENFRRKTFLGASKKNNKNSQKQEPFDMEKISEEADKVLKEGYEYIKLQEQNKAFGNLMFGDDEDTVIRKLEEDNNIEVVRSSKIPHFDEGGKFQHAKFKIGKVWFVINPEYYQNRLHKVVIWTPGRDYDYAKRGYEILVELISSPYGPADYTSDAGHSWYCGKKQISIAIAKSGSTYGVGCVITDTSITKEIEEKEREKERKDILKKDTFF